jgi:hypothetical protein
MPELEPKKEAQETPMATPPTEELDELQTKVHNLPEAKWYLYQRICGAALGLLCGYLLTFFGSYESVGMFGTIAAVLIALFVPNMIEKRVKRSLQKGRVALMIGLAAWMLVYLLIMLLNGTPMLANPA